MVYRHYGNKPRASILMSFSYGFALPAWTYRSGAYVPPYSFLLIEDGSFLLQEDGSKIGLEANNG